MNVASLVQIGLFLTVLVLLVKPLGGYMARVYEGQPCGLGWAVGWLERLVYRLTGIDASEEMTWTAYAKAMLVFNLLGIFTVYGLQRAQAVLPLNPQQMTAVPPELAMNTAVSFATNTNWQNYAPETTATGLSYLTQMLGLTVQNFLSAATGMAILVAMIRGFVRRNSPTIGNFWCDLVRSTLYILMPLSIIVALVLVSQGVVQTFDSYRKVTLIEPAKTADGKAVTEQTVAVGPAASQIAIKQLGTNGGGFFNANSAHPLEDPTPASNFIELLSLIVISAALCYTFGKMVSDTRQGWAIAGGDARAVRALSVVRLLFGANREPDLCRAGRRSAGWPSPAGRKHGRQGSAQRNCAVVDLGRRHHGYLQRQRQFDARQLYAAGRPGAAVADARGRGGLRRRRQRAVRHVGLRHHRRLHRRTDGRPHARVSGQENRGLRDEDGRPDRLGHADGGADRHGGGRGHESGQGRHCRIRDRMDSAKCFMRSPRPATTTAAPLPA